MRPATRAHRPSDPKLPLRIACPRCHGTGRTYQPLRGLISCPRCGGKKTVIVLETIAAEPGAPLHPTRRLSRLQKKILRNLGKFDQAPLGVSTKLLRQAESKTAAGNAAFARALARLEKRGLVIRTNHRTGIPGLGIIRTKAYQPAVRRTSHVILTALGQRVARWLGQFPETGRTPKSLPDWAA